MSTKSLPRRNFLQALSAAGVATAMPAFAMPGALDSYAGPVRHEALAPQAEPAPAHSINFGVCGISHNHVYGMIEAIKRGGGKFTVAWGMEPDLVAAMKKRYPDVKFVATQDEVINDPSIKLILSSQVANERAGIGVRAMKAGKDFLSDKPGITNLAQLAEVRRTIAATGKIYAIMYSERLEVKAAVHAGELVQQGAIGKVIQTINIAPHQVNQKPGGDMGSGLGGRPEWFWKPEQYGGILIDIGSHQVDQFLFYTGSTKAEVVASQLANVRHPKFPAFQDFGDMMLHGNNGFGYVRLDWFTPYGLGTWGDGRLFILGTEGYIEVRKYTNVAVAKQGNNLFLVDQKEARYIDCNNMPLPFGPQFVADIVNRTHTAQDQAQCLLAAELVIRAQMNARRSHVDWEDKPGLTNEPFPKENTPA
ncbi:Gfo/Idh/MocA family protein [Terriglobus aquaticus]|uniref:Gfo/Idh/MocA family protein n=1 Tax=Terriglobus aquaticus TaxID=940139 RepID=A0ABW9KFZ7_9BACT|nr:Gfo/Idh/MocA family oxidoreductase [Terriglobus aquaticus]